MNLLLLGQRNSFANPIDNFAHSFTLWIGWVVAIQSLQTIATQNNFMILRKLSNRLLGHETKSAIDTIKRILESAHLQKLASVYSNHTATEVWSSLRLYSRLQSAAKQYEAKFLNSTCSANSENDIHDLASNKVLWDKLAHYATFASAAYGWKMDLLLWKRLNRSSLETLLRRTGITKKDVLVAQWSSRGRCPAYFVARDSREKTIVVAIRGTWSHHDVLTDLCCMSCELDPTMMKIDPTSGASSASLGGAFPFSILSFLERMFGDTPVKTLQVHQGMLDAARALENEIGPLLQEELKKTPESKLILTGHSMGGGVAALLALMWSNPSFSTAQCNRYMLYQRLGHVFLYGSPCVIPYPLNDAIRATFKTEKIWSVVHEGDPFSCLSLGHIVELSSITSILCSDKDFKQSISERLAKVSVKQLKVTQCDRDELRECYEASQQLRRRASDWVSSIDGDDLVGVHKLYPPGRVILLSNYAKPSVQPQYREVDPGTFDQLILGSRMFDVTRHFPSLYERTLKILAHSAL